MVIAANEKDQRQLKASLLLDAMGDLKLDALTPGDGDFVFGVDFLVDGATQHGLPYVSANLKRTSGELLFPASRVVERRGLKIGITGVTGQKLTPKGLVSGSVKDALQPVVNSLRENGVDLVVVLSHQGIPETEALLGEVSGVDLVFAAHDRSFQIEPVVAGSAAIFQAGSRGKYLGEIDVQLLEGHSGWSNEAGRKKVLRRKATLERQLARYQQQLQDNPDERSQARAERALAQVERQLGLLVVPPPADGKQHIVSGKKVAMDRNVADEPAMAKKVEAVLEQLGDSLDPHAGHNHGHAGHNHGPGGHGKSAAAHRQSMTPSNGPYVGAQICAGCHPSEYADWSKSAHAKAYATLVADKRQFDQDCWSCHVTGAGQPGGPAHPKAVGMLRNVQCESCHGPGRKHIGNPAAFDMRKEVPEKLCVTCHDKEQTEGRFVYDTYLPKIDHKP